MSPTSRLIVIRAWWEAEHVRARILVDGEQAEGWVVDGVESVATLVGDLLHALEPEPDSR